VTSPQTATPDGGSDIRSRLAQALRAAMRDRDQAATAAVRSALAAIANAETVDPGTQPPATGSLHFAGAAAGLGATEAPRKVLTEAEIRQIVNTEIADRQGAASQYERGGHAGRAERLRAEIGALQAALRPPGTRQ
jgi:uncharacterized protein